MQSITRIQQLVDCKIGDVAFRNVVQGIPSGDSSAYY
jgi:hypothetical protein